MPLDRLMGIPVRVTNNHVTRHARVRPWKERLLTRPWRPFQRLEITWVPMDPVLLRLPAGERLMVIHPQHWKKLKQTFEVESAADKKR